LAFTLGASQSSGVIAEADFWWGHSLTDCASGQLEQDAWFVVYAAVLVMCSFRISLAILQSRFLLARNVWLYTFCSMAAVSLAGWLTARATFTNLSHAGFVVFVGVFCFSLQHRWWYFA